MRRTAVILSALAVGLLVASVPQAAATVPTVVDCAAGPVTLADTGVTYQLVGSCSNVTIEADAVSVSLPGAARLDVTGAHVTVIAAGPVSAISVRGAGASVTAPRAQSVSVDASHARIRVDDLRSLTLRGRHVRVVSSRGRVATVRGDDNRVAFARLRTLVVKGDGNQAVVRRGRTHVTVHGRGNVVRVQVRLRP